MRSSRSNSREPNRDRLAQYNKKLINLLLVHQKRTNLNTNPRFCPKNWLIPFLLTNLKIKVINHSLNVNFSSNNLFTFCEQISIAFPAF
jgi:hypothetical protein